MQYADRLDKVEAAAERSQFQNLGLRVLDCGQTQFSRLPLGVTETTQAQIDGQDLRPLDFLRRFNGMMASAATGDQDIDADHTLAAVIRRYKIGDTITVHLLHNGKEQSVDVVLEALTD